MYLINKFEKDILENSLNKIKEPKMNQDESLKPVSSLTKESQTLLPENIDESLDRTPQFSTEMTTQKTDNSKDHKQNSDSSVNEEPKDGALVIEKDDTVEISATQSKPKNNKSIRGRNKTLKPRKILGYSKTPRTHPSKVDRE